VGARAIDDDVLDGRGRDGDDDEVDRRTNLADAPIRADAIELVRVRVHGVDAPPKPTANEVRQDGAADIALLPRGSDHDDGFRLEDRSNALGDRATLPFRARADERRRRVGGKRHVVDAGVQGLPNDEAAFHEDFHHAVVVGEHIGLHLFHACRSRDFGKVFQKQRADPPSLIGVLHGEGCLRDRRLASSFPCVSMRK
jgi:hypothetical protein